MNASVNPNYPALTYITLERRENDIPGQKPVGIWSMKDGKDQWHTVNLAIANTDVMEFAKLFNDLNSTQRTKCIRHIEKLEHKRQAENSQLLTHVITVKRYIREKFLTSNAT